LLAGQFLQDYRMYKILHDRIPAVPSKIRKALG